MAAKAFARSTKAAAAILPRYFNSRSLIISGPCVLQRKGVTFGGLDLGLGLRSFSTNDQHMIKTDSLPTVEKYQGMYPLYPDDDGHFYKVQFRGPPGIGMNRDEMIESYVNCLTSAFGSEDEARKRMHSVSTRYQFYFVCNVSPEISSRIEKFPGVTRVDRLSGGSEKGLYDVRGEPFINGQPVPYDPKYYAIYEYSWKACHKHLRFEGRNAPRVPPNPNQLRERMPLVDNVPLNE